MVDTIQIFCWKCGKSFYIPSNMISLHDKLCKDCGSIIDTYFDKYKNSNLYAMYKLYTEGAFAKGDRKCPPTHIIQ